MVIEIPPPSPAPGKKGAKEPKPEKGAKKDEKDKDKKGKKKEKTPEEIQAEIELAKLEALAAALKEKEGERLELWKPYEHHIDTLVQIKMIEAATTTSRVFVNESNIALNPKLFPLFEILLELHDENVVYVRSAELDDPEGFFLFTQYLLDSTDAMGKYMQRIEKDLEVLDYFDDIMEDEEIISFNQILLNRVESGLDEAIEYINNFEDYTYLWMDDRQECLRQFLLYSRLLTPEEYDAVKDNPAAVKETPPQISQFKEQIDYYEDLYKQVKLIETEKVIAGWLRVDVKPLRQAILNTVAKWSNMYKQHLFNHVINSITELENFIEEAIAAMQTPLEEDDYPLLLIIMSYLVKVRDRQIATDVMFDPLKEIILLLKDYNMEFDEEIHVRLQELPDKWVMCKKVAVTTKQAVAPIQAIHISKIRRRISLFDVRQTMYREIFRNKPFFVFGCTNVYKYFDKANDEVTGLEEELKNLLDQATLFDIVMTEYKQLKLNRKEIKMLKQLWDFVTIVVSFLDEWKTTPWKKIDVDSMEMELKKFGKEIRAMDKELRGWDVYIQLENTIKNMLTSLRAVTELQNPAIRERHWIQLMQATKVRAI